MAIRITREANRVLEEATNRIFGRRINITPACTYGAVKPGIYKVNWSCCGEQDAETALEFAKKLTQAAQIAKMLNELELIEDREKETQIENKAEYEEAIDTVITELATQLLGYGNPFTLQDALEAM